MKTTFIPSKIPSIFNTVYILPLCVSIQTILDKIVGTLFRNVKNPLSPCSMLKPNLLSQAEFQEEFEICVDTLATYRSFTFVGNFIVINIAVGGGGNQTKL